MEGASEPVSEAVNGTSSTALTITNTDAEHDVPVAESKEEADVVLLEHDVPAAENTEEADAVLPDAGVDAPTVAQAEDDVPMEKAVEEPVEVPTSSLEGFNDMRDKLHHCFSDLEAQGKLISSLLVSWADLTGFLDSKAAELEQRQAEVERRENEVSAQARELEARENALTVREKELMQRVQEKRDAAFAAIEKERKSLLEKRPDDTSKSLSKRNPQKELSGGEKRRNDVAGDGKPKAGKESEKASGVRKEERAAPSIPTDEAAKVKAESKEGEGKKDGIFAAGAAASGSQKTADTEAGGEAAPLPVATADSEAAAAASNAAAKAEGAEATGDGKAPASGAPMEAQVAVTGGESENKESGTDIVATEADVNGTAAAAADTAAEDAADVEGSDEEHELDIHGEDFEDAIELMEEEERATAEKEGGAATEDKQAGKGGKVAGAQAGTAKGDTAAVSKEEKAPAGTGGKSVAPAEEAKGAAAKAGAGLKSNAAPKASADAKTPSAEEQRVAAALTRACELMDGAALVKVVTAEDSRRYLELVRSHLPAALAAAVDAPRLVLGVLEGFEPKGQGRERDSGRDKARERETPSDRRRREKADADQLRGCSLLAEALAELQARQAAQEGTTGAAVAGEGAGALPVAESMRKRAAALVERWAKSPAMSQGEESVAGEAWLLLQVVVAFGVPVNGSGGLRESRVVGYLAAVASRKQMREMCRAVGMEAKLPDILRRLVSSTTRFLDALYLAYRCDSEAAASAPGKKEAGRLGPLLQGLNPAEVLRREMRRIRSVVSEVTKNDKSLQAENEATAKEVALLRHVQRCIAECQLSKVFPADTIDRRLEQLERIRVERKRAAQQAKADARNAALKRPRPAGPAGDGAPAARRAAVAAAVSGALAPPRSPFAPPRQPHHHPQGGPPGYAHAPPSRGYAGAGQGPGPQHAGHRGESSAAAGDRRGGGGPPPSYVPVQVDAGPPARTVSYLSPRDAGPLPGGPAGGVGGRPGDGRMGSAGGAVGQGVPTAVYSYALSPSAAQYAGGSTYVYATPVGSAGGLMGTTPTVTYVADAQGAAPLMAVGGGVGSGVGPEAYRAYPRPGEAEGGARLYDYQRGY